MELSEQAKEDMKFLGNFTPYAGGNSCFKGYMLDEIDAFNVFDEASTTVYLYESDFRNLAKSCLEVAEYLASRK